MAFAAVASFSLIEHLTRLPTATFPQKRAFVTNATHHVAVTLRTCSLAQGQKTILTV